MINDSHCHFFSGRFFEVLAQQKGLRGGDGARKVTELLQWEGPGTPAQLADRWIQEMDRNGVSRIALIASVPGDEESVAAAVRRHPSRFVGYFMVDPQARGAVAGVKRALRELGLRCVCLYPAMHHFNVFDPKVVKIFETAAAEKNTAVFVHCGVLSVGVRKKLGLPSPFDIRYGNPVSLHRVALDYPELPIIIPHFGAGFFREALMVADLCPNIYLDTSSSNQWMKYESELDLKEVFCRALEVLGAERLLFGTDSSFFPRGWQQPMYEAQKRVLQSLRVDVTSKERIFRSNFDRLFPPFMPQRHRDTE